MTSPARQRPRFVPIAWGKPGPDGFSRESKWSNVRGIQMRSRLEADFARHLDQIDVKWDYEPRLFFHDGRGYLPDFLIHLGDRPCYVEVKPNLLQATAAQARMEWIWEDVPDAFLVIVCAEESQWFGANRGTPWVQWVERWKHL